MSRGYVYVLPLHNEDWLKLGISNDPLRRAAEFSPRYARLFDFDRALLVETETPRDAAAIELRLAHALGPMHRAVPPLGIRGLTGGEREWYRGAYDRLDAETARLALEGHTVHAPARAWFREALAKRSDQVYGWASALLREYGVDPDRALTEPLPAPLARALDEHLGNFREFGIDVSANLPPALAG